MAGVRVLTDNRQRLLRHVRLSEITVIRLIGQEYLREVRHLHVDLPKTGRLYRVGGGLAMGRRVLEGLSAAGRRARRAGVHQASAPGEAPAVRTGVLLRSIAGVLEETATGVEMRAGTTLSDSYPVALEFGAAALAPRPMWRPAFQTAVTRGAQIVTRAGVKPEVVGAAFGLIRPQ